MQQTLNKSINKLNIVCVCVRVCNPLYAIKIIFLIKDSNLMFMAIFGGNETGYQGIT